jgi:hypothetical protein
MLYPRLLLDRRRTRLVGADPTQRRPRRIEGRPRHFDLSAQFPIVEPREQLPRADPIALVHQHLRQPLLYPGADGRLDPRLQRPRPHDFAHRLPAHDLVRHRPNRGEPDPVHHQSDRQRHDRPLHRRPRAMTPQ